MALPFNAIAPWQSTSSSSSFSPKKLSQSRFSCCFSRPRKRFSLGNFSSFSVKIDSALSDVDYSELQHQSNGVGPTSACTSIGWTEFARNVSGEWDGFGADFSKEGNPIELPESVVPEAYREWEVKVFDWQTQCPTLADNELPVLDYKLIKLLPTVGCEADAATRYNIDERNVGGLNSKVSGFAYHPSGCYVSLWPVGDKSPPDLTELEHCLINPQDRESRVRVIQVISAVDGRIVLKGIRVFVEQWYGPFRNGDQLGGCSIRDSAFASTSALKASEVVGLWQGSKAVARFAGSQLDTVQQLVDDSVQKSVRDESDIILLPKQLWCSIKESKDGDTSCEVGWLLSPSQAITSNFTFSSDISLKEVSVASETLECI